jgi:PqqD family protein of HPr-rel-A system
VKRWELKLKLPLMMRQWDEAQFIFDPASGQTHYFNTTCAEIIQLLKTHPRQSIDELYRRVLAEHAIEEDPEFEKALRDIIVLLERLGVVQSFP